MPNNNSIVAEYTTSSQLFKSIYSILGVKKLSEAANRLGLFQSVFTDSARRGVISDKVYIALAKNGYDIRRILSDNAPEEIITNISKILGVHKDYKDIADALNVKIYDIKECEELGQITDRVYVALAKTGYDIRRLWSESSQIKD